MVLQHPRLALLLACTLFTAASSCLASRLEDQRTAFLEAEQALQRAEQGLKLTSGSGSNVYTVNGTVKVGRPTSGQQTVKIDWVVNDPQGQKLGTVSQANKVPKGTLDGKWGPIADAAASSAADGIVKLIPKR